MSAHDIPVKCTRRRHQRMESERRDMPLKCSGISMTEAQIHLNKTLCAMRWIALMTCRNDVARAIEKDMENHG